jgi:DNA mismatch repair protein MutH
VPAFEPGNSAALRHGATIERQIRPVAANHRRRVLRRIGLSARDLDAIARGYLDLYVRLAAKIELADRYLEENGLLRPDGTPQPVLSTYTSWVNAARLALGRLEEHLRARIGQPCIEPRAARSRHLRPAISP